MIEVSGGNQLVLTSAVVALSNWTWESQWEPVSTSSGFSIPLTLNLYNVDGIDAVGLLIDSITVNATIPWRPEPTPGVCPAGPDNQNNNYMASDSNCYPGLLSTVTFNIPGVAVPNQFIYGIAFNTQDFGATPYGIPGPYDALNIAMSSDPPTVGNNPLPDTAYLNSSSPSYYTDGGAAGVGTFRQDQGWSPYSAAIQFDGSTPEPGTLLLFGFGAAAIGIKTLRSN